MIIRHDLKLIFLHVPKCAGKQLRDVWLDGSKPDSTEDLFNFAYSERLHRYVDLAHLTMDDLVHFDVSQYLSAYTVVAAIRHPYQRLRSAVHEYYRQFSSADEAIVNRDDASPAMRLRYLQELPKRHGERDPRFVHSFPITWFTHYGTSPKADYILRCDSLRDDMIALAHQLELPPSIAERASTELRNQPEIPSLFGASPLTEGEREMAHILYAQDFQTFGFSMVPVSNVEHSLAEVVNQLKPVQRHSHSLDLLWTADHVQWHWGPGCSRTQSYTPEPVRSRLYH